jgi:hypothetical protein
MTSATVETEPTEATEIGMRGETPDKIAVVMAELSRIRETKRDYIVGAGDLGYRVDPETEQLQMTVNHGGLIGTAGYGMAKASHAQVAEKLGPNFSRYYRRLREGNYQDRELLATNVNHWLGKSQKNYLVRTLDDTARAFLSDRFRVLDNADLLFGVWDTLKEVGAKVVRVDLTEDRFYIRAMHEDWEFKIEHQQAEARSSEQLFSGFSDSKAGGIHKNPADMTIGQASGENLQNPMHLASRGDSCTGGIVLSNSETGQGRLMIEPFVFRHYCSNLAVFGESIARAHVGSTHDLAGLLSDETIKAESSAIWGMVNDVTRATFDPEQFRAMVDRMSVTTGQMLAAPQEAVSAVVRHYGLSETREQAIINELISGGDASVFGLINAVTAAGRKEASYTRGIELERIGGQLVTEAADLVAVR